MPTRVIHGVLCSAALLVAVTACGDGPKKDAAPAAAPADAGGVEAWFAELSAHFAAGDGAAVYEAYCPELQAEIAAEDGRQDFIESIFSNKGNPETRQVLGEPLTDEQKVSLGRPLSSKDYLAALIFSTDDREVAVVREEGESWCLGSGEALEDALGDSDASLLPSAAQVQDAAEAEQLYADEVKGQDESRTVSAVSCTADGSAGWTCTATVSSDAAPDETLQGRVLKDGNAITD